MNSASTPFDAWATSLAAAQANVLASSRAQAALLNENLKAIYLGKFNDWKISVDAGRIDNSNPPLPPKSYTVDFFTDPTNADVRWCFPIQNGPQVCELPPIPEDRSKTQVQVGTTGNDRVRNVAPDDHFPVGFELTAADGGRWQKQASPTPFGVAFYYARVA